MLPPLWRRALLAATVLATDLADIGIRGSGHVRMLEKNNEQIARELTAWLDQELH